MCAGTLRAQSTGPIAAPPNSESKSTGANPDYNQRLDQLTRAKFVYGPAPFDDYRLGAEDLLEIDVLEAADIGRTVRISSSGEISLPLLGGVRAAGLTPRELESVLEVLLRQSFMKDPHVSVFVKEMQSHSVSVFGAVQKPGVFQIRGAKPLIEVLSMAEGLATDAGDTATIIRAEDTAASVNAVPGATTSANPPIASEQKSTISANAPTTPASTGDANGVQVSLKDLLDSGDPRSNVLVFPGDVVKVNRAGIVYVVGEVHKPGGFLLSTNENISVLQAIALAEGVTHTSSTKKIKIIHTDSTGARTETTISLNRILSGKDSDLSLHAKDIVFVPNSAGKTAFFHGTEDAIQLATGVAIYRR